MPSKFAAHLSFESGGHGVGGLSDGNDEDAVVGIEIVQVVANAQDTALAVHVAGESAFDGGVAERGDEDLAGDLPHLAEVLLAFGRHLRHGRDYKAIEALNPFDIESPNLESFGASLRTAP